MQKNIRRGRTRAMPAGRGLEGVGVYTPSHTKRCRAGRDPGPVLGTVYYSIPSMQSMGSMQSMQAKSGTKISALCSSIPSSCPTHSLSIPLCTILHHLFSFNMVDISRKDNLLGLQTLPTWIVISGILITVLCFAVNMCNLVIN